MNSYNVLSNNNIVFAKTLNDIPETKKEVIEQYLKHPQAKDKRISLIIISNQYS